MSDNKTFGPTYNEKIDGKRISGQMAKIKHFMLSGSWRTLAEISKATRYPESSISAQLRHLRKAEFGGHDVQKRRRKPDGGTWEYKVRAGKKTGEQTGMFL